MLYAPAVLATTNFDAGALPSRSLGTAVTNGKFRRLVFVYANCAGATTGKATLQATTWQAGGTALGSSTDLVGVASGSAITVACMLILMVDPGSTYEVSAATGTGASVSLLDWVEIDL